MNHYRGQTGHDGALRAARAGVRRRRRVHHHPHVRPRRDDVAAAGPRAAGAGRRARRRRRDRRARRSTPGARRACGRGSRTASGATTRSGGSGPARSWTSAERLPSIVILAAAQVDPRIGAGTRPVPVDGRGPGQPRRRSNRWPGRCTRRAGGRSPTRGRAGASSWSWCARRRGEPPARRGGGLSPALRRTRSRCRPGRGRWPCGPRCRRSRARPAPARAPRSAATGVVVADHDRVLAVPGVLGPHFDVDEPVLGELPHRLDVVGQHRRRAAEEPLVPGRRYRAVADGDAREQVDGHGGQASHSPPLSGRTRAGTGR